ncbi:MAG TPA: glycosyltransferase family 4 protein [Pyrinomonadaceae bacterium]|jgi:glycosyltransferase involved in cell wall biosynthesis
MSKILITAPSLETQHNVSGISSVVGQIVARGASEFYHFAAGRRDGEKTSAGWFFRQISAIPRLRREIQAKKIDVVHINTALAPLSIMRDAALAKAANRPILLHLHGGRFFTQKFSSSFFERLTGKMLAQAKVVVVLSELERKFIEKRWPQTDVRVLENAVALDEVQPRKSETSEKTIVFLGRIHRDKGLREIIEACRILKEEKFRFDFKCYGTGEAENFFAAEMTKILGDKFFYGGIVSGAEKWRALAESDIFVLPSYYEGLPVALLEAMAAGCVPVASRIGSIPSVINDGSNGFLTGPRNVAQIAEKLKFLLSGQADWRLLRRNARETIEKKYNFNDYIKRLESIYAEIKVDAES